jgi:hypothetical protein
MVFRKLRTLRRTPKSSQQAGAHILHAQRENSQISITDDTVRFHAEKHGCIAIYSSSTLYLLQGVPLSSLAHIEDEKGKRQNM